MAAKTSSPIAEKVTELCEELKRTGFWQARQPDWVLHYRFPETVMETGFCEWLQFIYLPNLWQQAQHQRAFGPKENIAPQAVKFFGNELRQGKLLQLLIELDSLL